jgi:hypothetical protein
MYPNMAVDAAVKTSSATPGVPIRICVEQAGGDAGDTRPERLDPARRERAAHQPAQPRVVRRVAVQHAQPDGVD